MRRAFVLIVLTTICSTSSSVYADDPANQKRLRELLVERRDILREAVAEYVKAIRANEFSSVDPYLSTVKKLRSAELELCRTAVERLAAQERQLALAMAVEREVGQRFRVGGAEGSAANEAAVRGDRLAVETGLIRSRAALVPDTKDVNPNGRPVKEPTDKLLRVLSKYRRDVLRRRVEATVAEEHVGTKTISDVVAARTELLRLELAMTDDRLKQVEVYKRHIQKLIRHKHEQEARARFSIGGGVGFGAAYVHAIRLSAEIEMRLAVADVKGLLVKFNSEKDANELKNEYRDAHRELIKQVRQSIDSKIWRLHTNIDILVEALQQDLRREETHAGRMRLHQQHVEELRKLEERYTPPPGREKTFQARGNVRFLKAARLAALIGKMREQMRDGKNQAGK